MADLAGEIWTYCNGIPAIKSLIAERNGEGMMRMFGGVLPQEMPPASEYRGKPFDDVRDLPAVTFTVDIDQDHTSLSGLIGRIRATARFDCYSLRNTGPNGHIAIRNALRNALGSLQGKMNDSLWIYDSMPQFESTTFETYKTIPTSFRFIANLEISITYQEVTTTIGV